MTCTIIWFRQDLRLEDNHALLAAFAEAKAILPVYIYSEEEEELGAASKLWLHYALKSLTVQVQRLGASLIIRSAKSSKEELLKLVKETKASSVLWNRRYEPNIIKRDQQIKEALKQINVRVESFNSALLLEPWEVKTQQGNPFQVYTPFWKRATALLHLEFRDRVTLKSQMPITNIPTLTQELESLDLQDLNLVPVLDWKDNIIKRWKLEEMNAEERLQAFLDRRIDNYKNGRDLPAKDGVSGLSPYLHFGQISPCRIWYLVTKRIKSLKSAAAIEACTIYLKELVWREFAYHLLYHFPHTVNKPLRESFNNFPWKKNKKLLKQWQAGLTGYPMVDAGMRELWHTGWMHNRVRMIVASFLIKDLMLPWQEGAAWFWDTLLDADLASNTMGWQWTAGSGADASPYFRVFNPTRQGERFDANAEYLRRWIPELKNLDSKWIHKPFEAPAAVLMEAGVVLGKDYPEPIVNHEEARKLALLAYKQMKDIKN